MSLAREIRLSIAPEQVALVRVSGVWRKRASAVAWRPVVPEAGQPAWMPALARLNELLQASAVRQARATVVLSNQLVRYAVVPAAKDLETTAEQLAYARARFAQIHGDAARDWDLRIGCDPPGSARLAAALDPGLVEALRNTLAANSIRLSACRPALTAAFDAMRNRIAAESWIIAGDPGRVLVARIRAGQWASVRVRPLEGKTLELEEITAQEGLLVPSAGGECSIYVTAAAGLRIETEGVHARVFGPTQPRGLAPEAHVNAALAMAGMG